MPGPPDHDGARRALVGVPALPGSARLARIAAADAGTRAGMAVEDIEDLRLAVDEAFFVLVDVAADGAELGVECTWDDDGVTVELGVALADGRPLVLPEVAGQIVAALVDGHAHAAADGRGTFRLRKRRAGSG